MKKTEDRVRFHAASGGIRRLAWAFALLASACLLLPLHSRTPDPVEEETPREVEVAGTISYIGGRAFRDPAGREDERLALSHGESVHVGDVVLAEGGPVEIELADRSALRVSAGSRLALDEAATGAEEETRSVSVRLLVGRAWATVTGALRGEDEFEVRTQSAAAGVRGTSFRVDAREDRSTLVRVYQGAVGVRGLGQTAGPRDPEPGQERRQVEGPAQVTRQEWERRVEAMMGVEVSAAGQVGEATPFDPEADRQDPWVRWNTERDADR